MSDRSGPRVGMGGPWVVLGSAVPPPAAAAQGCDFSGQRRGRGRSAESAQARPGFVAWIRG